MLRVTLLLLVIILLPACARMELASHVVKQLPVPAAKQSKGTFKVGSAYRIAGKTYKPQETYNFTQTGIASWYGPNFHGKKTANGEIFDKYELTAAHKTLQMPSLVRVTNLENGRSIVVRINDRGPFKKGRIIDLSQRGAELLDFKHRGIAKVKIQVLDEESRKLTAISKQGGDTRGFEVTHNESKATPVIVKKQPPPVYERQIARTAISAPANVFVQAGSFGNHGNATALVGKLQNYGPAHITETTINGNQYYRVRLGPLSSPQANKIRSELASADIGEPIIVSE